MHIDALCIGLPGSRLLAPYNAGPCWQLSYCDESFQTVNSESSLGHSSVSRSHDAFTGDARCPKRRKRPLGYLSRPTTRRFDRRPRVRVLHECGARSGPAGRPLAPIPSRVRLSLSWRGSLFIGAGLQRRVAFTADVGVLQTRPRHRMAQEPIADDPPRPDAPAPSPLTPRTVLRCPKWPGEQETAARPATVCLVCRGSGDRVTVVAGRTGIGSAVLVRPIYDGTTGLHGARVTLDRGMCPADGERRDAGARA